MIFWRFRIYSQNIGLVFIKRRYSHIMESNIVSDSLKRSCDEVISSDEQSEKKLKTEVPSSDKSAPSINRIRKPKKVVVLLCYLGKKYYGMQRNHGVVTVESDLLKALLQAGIILPEEVETPQLMKFQRAARTDKGVSAAQQIVSLKIPINDISESFPCKVNQYLPPDIRVLCVKRVTQAFDAKIACDARTYSYMLPTFAFSNSKIVNEEFRISEERLTEVNGFLKTFVGTHNFYNFTSGRLPNDASCKRYIMSCECGKPFILDNLEFVVIKIKGQSFMLHQIRKMVGLTIAVLQQFVSKDDILERVWKNNRIDIPMAPSLGLMLEEVHYDWYNKKYGSDGLHEPLSWDLYQETINKFREEQILANMVHAELKEKSMVQWLQTLPYHTYDIREQKANSKIVNNVNSTSEQCLENKVQESSDQLCNDNVQQYEGNKEDGPSEQTDKIFKSKNENCAESNEKSSGHLS